MVTVTCVKCAATVQRHPGDPDGALAAHAGLVFCPDGSRHLFAGYPRTPGWCYGVRSSSPWGARYRTAAFLELVAAQPDAVCARCRGTVPTAAAPARGDE